MFYEYENGEIKQKEFFDEGYSLSVNDLRKYSNGVEEFYINKYTLKLEPTKYITYYDKIFKNNGILKTENIFSIEEIYDENSKVSYIYNIKGNAVDSDAYYQVYNDYFKDLEKDILVTTFISSEDFEKMSKEEKKISFEKAYGDEIYKYVNEIKDDVASLSKVSDTKTLDIILTEDIYGSELAEYKENLETEDIFAQLITDEKNFVTIMPMPDFLNNQNYYFKEGKLVAYKEEFIGIGGAATYYFENNELLFIDETEIEEEMTFVSKDINSILERVNVIYKNYIK